MITFKIKFIKHLTCILLALVITGTITLSFLINESNVNATEAITEQVNNNTQEYIINKETGEKRTILWTKGIDAPKMASDDELLNAEGRYFRKKVFNEIDGNYSMYYYPMESNKGYFDFNKNPARINIHPQQVAHHCYLASAMNLLYWWLEQNSSYIDRYVDLISKGYFTQSPDLHPINDLEMWKRYRATPQVNYINDRDYYSMDLSDNSLYKEVFKSFQTRDEGYWPDLVLDGFFNGYTPNGKEELYMPARDGGFFYPLLGKESIVKRINMGSYEFFSKTVLENLKAGNAIGLSYLSVGPAHAITIWGAEVNEAGDLVRLYFTDSDDFDPSEKTEEGILKGLYSNEVVKDSTGAPRLTTRDDRTKGSKVDALFILSLAQDKLEESLNDLADPIAPKFKEPLQNLGYKDANEDLRSLSVNVVREDNGIYSYQWYEANDLTAEGKIISGATNSIYTPKPIVGIDKYYYCVVTNTKNGKKISSTTNRSRVFIDPNVINALKPNVSYNLNNGKREFVYNQYVQPKPLVINVDKKDDGIITYQWYQRESISNSSPFGATPIEGEIYPVFYPKTNVAGVAVDYYCIVTNTNDNANGVKVVTATPSKVLTVITLNPGSLKNAMTPNIVKQPIASFNYSGKEEIPTLSIYANASDEGNLTYQWYVADDEFSTGEKIPNAILPTYKPKLDYNGTKYYYCEVTNTNDLASVNQTAVATSNRTMISSSITSTLNNNANLSNIEISNGSLDPVFNKNTLIYNIVLPHNISSITINGIADDIKAKVEGNQTVNIDYGQKISLTIKVTAEDGVTTKTYTINVYRNSVINSVTILNSYIYNGLDQDVKLKVLNINNINLTLDKDYKIEYLTNRVNAGKVGFKVIGLNEYSGYEEEFSFDILKAILNVSNIEIETNSFVFNNMTQAPQIKLTFKGKTLKENIDYVVHYPYDMVGAGEKEVTISGMGNFSLEYTFNYTINKAKNNVAITIIGDEIKTDADFGDVKYKYYKDALGLEVIDKPTQNGIYYIKGYVEESDNYEYGESIILPFNIIKVFGKVEIKDSYVYNGNEHNVNVEVYNNKNELLVLNQDYKIVYLGDRTNAGDVFFKVVGINDYVNNLEELSFNIEKALNEVTINNNNGIITASSLFGNPIIKYFSDEACSNEISKPEKAGTYYVKAVVEESANYKYAESSVLEYVIAPNIEDDKPNDLDNKGMIIAISLIGASFVLIGLGVCGVVIYKKKIKK